MRDECAAATPAITAMRTGKVSGGVGMIGNREGAKNELHFLPLFAPHLGSPLVTAVARAALDSHVRIAQLHIRHVDPDGEETNDPGNSAIMPSGRLKRGWHTCAPANCPSRVASS